MLPWQPPLSSALKSELSNKVRKTALLRPTSSNNCNTQSISLHRLILRCARNLTGDAYPSVLLFRRSVVPSLAGDTTPQTALPSEGTGDPDEPPGWEGQWDTNWGTMVLRREKDGRISGIYGPAGHSVTGTIDPKDPAVLAGTWKHSNSSLAGRFQFRMHKPGRFQGAWTHGDADPSEKDTNWTGIR